MKLSALFTSTMERVREMLKADMPVRGGSWSSPEVEMIRNKLGALITTKPTVYLVNLSQEDFCRKKNKWLPKVKLSRAARAARLAGGRLGPAAAGCRLAGCASPPARRRRRARQVHAWVAAHGGGAMVPISVEFERELWAQREAADKGAAFLEQTGAKSMLPKLIKLGYSELNLIYFFTAGEKEVRCWTVQAGALAPQAAGVIHSDFERGFIKAETVSYDDFKAVSTGPSMAEVKAAGKYRIEGKTYVVCDADILHFQFNVTSDKKK